MKLHAPESYWNTPSEEIDKITGGCGPGGLGDFLVPDKILGLSIFKSCRIHDYEYHIGKNLADKIKADNRFRDNMVRIIKVKTKWKWLRKSRLWFAKRYYRAVKEYGGPAFWDDKINLLEFQEA